MTWRSTSWAGKPLHPALACHSLPPPKEQNLALQKELAPHEVVSEVFCLSRVGPPTVVLYAPTGMMQVTQKAWQNWTALRSS